MAGLAVAGVGLLVLVGWMIGNEQIKGMFHPITMKTNAALSLLVCGSGLWAYSRGWRLPAACGGALAAIVGGATLSEHLFGWELGIDQFLFTEEAGALATASPNRMGLNASTSFVLAGVALLLLVRGTATAVARAQRLALLGLLLAMLAIAGYIYGAIQLYAISRVTGIAVHTAVSLLVLHAGIFIARADIGPMAAFAAEGPSGTLLRRLIAPIVLLPLVLGYLVLRGRLADFYDRGLGYALFAVALVVVLCAVVWQTAKTIAASDMLRRRAEHDRDLLLIRERQARDAAENASRLKDQFIATLSHELRTPLNVMLGWTKVLEQPAPSERHARAAEVVARNGRLLARLVEDLLDISRATAGQFEITRQPLAFNAVVQGTIDALTPLATANGVRLEPELDPAVGTMEGDAERIQQIIWNLLSNAIKFTPAGGHVRISTTRDDACTTVTVSDTGIGFDERFAAQLFQPFRQADSSSRREFGGLGLGLSIARHIAELHGGTITGASPGPGRGASFTVRLPSSGRTVSIDGLRPPGVPWSGTPAAQGHVETQKSAAT